MYLGRIITNSRKIDTIDMVDITNDLSLVSDNTIPTLVIGKQNAIDAYGVEKIHFMNRQIDKNHFWTFGKTERRNDYEKDLKSFNELLVNSLSKNVNYHNFNIFTESLDKIKQFIRFIDLKEKKVVYVTDKQAYIYHNNKVYGLSFDDLEYIGVKRDKVIHRLKRNYYNQVITNEYFLSKNMKKVINGSKILVPYIYFVDKM